MQRESNLLQEIETNVTEKEGGRNIRMREGYRDITYRAETYRHLNVS